MRLVVRQKSGELVFEQQCQEEQPEGLESGYILRFKDRFSTQRFMGVCAREVWPEDRHPRVAPQDLVLESVADWHPEQPFCLRPVMRKDRCPS